MAKAVVLLSSGLDSTVNLYSSLKDFEVSLALTFDYGQKSAKKEVECSRKLCEKLGVKHKVLDLSFFKDIGKSSLIEKDQHIPSGNEVSIDDKKVSLETAKSVWVPNRNGIFLNIAAGFAESLGAQKVIPGFNKEEAETFPDNSVPYLKSVTQALTFSTSNKVEVHCYTSEMKKSEIVKHGKSLNVDWMLMWPCYHNHEKWCGQCESCQRSKRALEENSVHLSEAWL